MPDGIPEQAALKAQMKEYYDTRYGEGAYEAFTDIYCFHTEASFVFPVINNTLYLAQRNTQPHKGMWGPVGGKKEQLSENTPERIKPHYIQKMGGALVESLYDITAKQDGLETDHQAGEREFAEEIYADRSYPDRFSQDAFTKHCRIGYVYDAQTHPFRITRSSMILMEVNDTDFSLNEREITDFKPIHDVKTDEMFEIGKVALKEIQYWQKRFAPKQTGGQPNNLKFQYFQQKLVPEDRDFSTRKTYHSLSMVTCLWDMQEKMNPQAFENDRYTSLQGWWMDRR